MTKGAHKTYRGVPALSGDASEDAIVQVRGLHTAFGAQQIHRGLDLDVRRGEILGVVGGSGTGKSVLMRAIIGLKRIQEGRIYINGRDQSLMSEAEMKASRRDWGVLFQDGALFTSLTVGQNIQVPMREHYKLSRGLMDELACSKINLAGLPDDTTRKYPSELSGGMRKRAALARALALDPELLFLDEPTAGLDPIGASAFDRLIMELRDALGLTVFLVTHDLDTLVRACDRIAVLGDGKILICDTLDAVMKFDHAWVKDYFHGPRARAAGMGV